MKSGRLTGRSLFVGLGHEVVGHVAVHTHEGRLLELVFKHRQEVAVELTVHEQDVVALGVGGLDVAVLLYGVGGVDVDHVAVLVGLRGFDEGAVFLKGEIFAFGVAQECELEGGVAEFLVGEHAVFDENLDVVPL